VGNGINFIVVLEGGTDGYCSGSLFGRNSVIAAIGAFFNT
jgi:hypothetical protein